MERINRKPFQGVFNIIRFNWHYYVIALGVLIVLLLSAPILPNGLQIFVICIIVLTVSSITTSLIVSYYIYDCSNLYTLDWLNELNIGSHQQLVNIHAGFDETSARLKQKYPLSILKVFDFYDPSTHTEISIERARKAYPVFAGTQIISTMSVPLEANAADYIFLLFSAHEIRNPDEKIIFFKQLQQALCNDGSIIVVEHLRDIYNFIAYNFGFFHFFSRKSWKHMFNKADLTELKEIKITPFIRAFILKKNGITS